MWWIALMYGLWSSVFSFGKMALSVSPPLFLTAFRMLFASAILLSIVWFKQGFKIKIKWKQIKALIVLGICNIYLTNAFEFWSLSQMTAAKTCFFYSLCPFFSALFSYLHFDEKMNLKKWIGMGIGFLGFIPVLTMQKGSSELLSSLEIITLPELSMLAASISTSYGWILLRILLKNDPISPLTANGASMFFGGLVALGHSMVFEIWNPIPISIANFAPFIKGILMMTLISNLICYNLYGLALKKYTATLVSFMGLLSPIFASINGWIILSEPIALEIVISTVIVSIGLWLIYSAELRQGYYNQ
jgi:drug/metabolite transporter (DMT)-like permease